MRRMLMMMMMMMLVVVVAAVVVVVVMCPLMFMHTIQYGIDVSACGALLRQLLNKY